MPVFKVDYSLIENKFKHLLNDNKLINKLQIRNDISFQSLDFANKDLIKQLIYDSNNSLDLKPNIGNNFDSINVIEGNSDLIVNQYEGGFKLWEGLEDIIDYFIQNNLINEYSSHQNLNILELGCGSGLASIYCSKKLPKANIYLQDFNEEVIKYFTAINVLLNNQISNSEAISRFNYMFGDWTAISEEINSSGLKFDLIFSSETLYNCDNYGKLFNVFESSLDPNGLVYIASKSHYFGVGGGTYSFMDFIDTKTQFECEICHEIEAPLIRHILKLWQKK